MEDFTLRPASAADAPAIARAIMDAVGQHIVLDLAGDPSRVGAVADLFTSLAARDDSQYSYRNAVVAVTPSGDVAGVVVCYDGADLPRLRRAFADEAARHLGMHVDPDSIPDETTPDEVYLDSLAVFPQWRGRGLAAQLIDAAAARAAALGKPLGLLCDPPNTTARRLYDRVGFRQVGQRPFLGTLMDHLQRPL